MKTPQFLYSLARLVGVSILVCFLVFATESSPERIWKQRPPVETTPTVRSEKKTCLCCKKTMDRLRKRIQQAGERKRKAQKGSTRQLPQEEPLQTYQRRSKMSPTEFPSSYHAGEDIHEQRDIDEVSLIALPSPPYEL